MSADQEASQPFASPVATGADRRTSEREFPRRTAVRVMLEGTWREFQVLDESEGGLGIFASDKVGLDRGSFVDVDCEFVGHRRAEIRYIAPHQRGGFHIGLMWDTSQEGQ